MFRRGCIYAHEWLAVNHGRLSSLRRGNSLRAGSWEGTLTERRTLGSTVRRVINEHIADVHRRVLRRDHFELVCECGDCELVTIQVPAEVYHEARSHPDSLLVDPEHILDADVVAHRAGVSIVRPRA